MDFVGKRYIFFLVSLAVIVPGLVFLVIAPGLNLGIDFTGGSSLTLQVGSNVEATDMRSGLADLGYPESSVQGLGNSTFFVRTRALDEAEKDTLLNGLRREVSPDGVAELSFDLVSPVVARDTVRNGFYAVLAAAAGIFFYLWWAFRSVPSPFRYGAAAIIALIHDTVIVVGVFAILGVLFDTEVNTMFLIAILTVIGYSVNDTIVVFDRLRENTFAYPNRTLAENVNVSLSESLGRSLNTSFTLLFTLLALLLFGGQTIQTFLLVLIIGVVAGTYSSIAVASQVLVAWESGDVGRFISRLRPGGSSRRRLASASR